MISLSKKVCLLGDYSVGKTSLVRRFVHNLFDDKYISTIGVKVSRKVVVVPRVGELAELTILLWDLAGSEEFDQVRMSYLRGSAGGLLVCDLTRPETLESLRGYAEELWSVAPNSRLVLAANKRDLTSQARVSDQQVCDLAAELRAPCFFTSAKTGQEVETLFRHLGSQLIA